MASCILPHLHKEFDIHFYGNPRAKEVLKANPHISKWIMHEDDSVPLTEIEEHWVKIGRGYDKVVNCTSIVENELLFSYPQNAYFWPLEKRRRKSSRKNYYDEHLIRAEINPVGLRPMPDIYFIKSEIQKRNKWEAKHQDKFKIVWALVGSSIHKAYRYFETVALTFLRMHPDAVLFTVGDYMTKLLTFDHPRCYNTMMIGPHGISFREAMLLTSRADVVIGPETGIINAAAAFDRNIICLLSHSSPKNLTWHWDNTLSLQAHCYCSPCHLLHRFKEIWRLKCQVSDLGFPRCCDHGPGYVLDGLEASYDKFKRSSNYV